MKKNNPPEPSDLQSLITSFESLTSELKSLDLADAEEREVVSTARVKLNSLEKEVNEILVGNERARRERLVKLSNLQELLKPILFPENDSQPCRLKTAQDVMRSALGL